MKITCPNCQKIYTINKAKIPPGIKAAKCKALKYLPENYDKKGWMEAKFIES